MKKYNVDLGFWRHGLWVEPGSSVTMSEKEAKYLGHALSEDKGETPEPAAVAEAPADEPASDPVAGVSVSEKPHRRKRGEADGNSEH